MVPKVAATPVLAAPLLLLCLCSAYETYQQEVEFNGTLTSEQIFVNTEDGRTLSVLIEPADTVEDLKNKIQDIEGTPANRIRLLCGSLNWLISGAKLKSKIYNVTSGTVLTMILNEDEGYNDTKFFVKNLNDEQQLEVNMQLNKPAARLMDNIARWTGIPNWQQRILSNGKQLQPERRLLSYAIFYPIKKLNKNDNNNNVSTLRLGKPLESCRILAKILVKTLSGATISIEIELDQSATDLKRNIETNAGVPLIVQHLVFNQQVVAGEDHLCDYGLEEGSQVYLVLVSSSIDTPEKVKILVVDPVVSQSGQNPDTDNSNRAPIFREADVTEEPVTSQSQLVAIYKDVRNWVFERRQRPEKITALFASVA